MSRKSESPSGSFGTKQCLVNSAVFGIHPPVDSFASEYPFEPRFHVTPGGARMHYLDQGAGRPWLMVHGNPTWSFMYRSLVRDISGEERCVVPDHVGCGRSEKPEDGQYVFNLKTRIDDLESLVLALDLRDMTLVVHDWGGAIGIGVAARHPDRFRDIVVMNTAAFWLPRLPWRIRVCGLPVLGDLLVRGFNVFAGAAVFMAPGRLWGLTAEARKGFLAPYDNWRNRRAVLEFVRDIPMTPGHPSYGTILEVEEGLGRISGKVKLIIWGMRDFCFDETFLLEWRRRCPDASIHRFPGAGHYLLEDVPDSIAGIIRHHVGMRDDGQFKSIDTHTE